MDPGLVTREKSEKPRTKTDGVNIRDSLCLINDSDVMLQTCPD